MKRLCKFLAFALTMLILCPLAFAYSSPSTKPISDEIAQTQYQTLMCSFGFENELSDIIYPENYGCSYINSDGIFVVTQTDTTSSKEAAFTSCLSKSGNYIVETVDHSYNELLALKNTIDNVYSSKNTTSDLTSAQTSLLDSITSFHISQKDNAIVVGISNLNDEKIDTFYSMFGDSSAYIFTEGVRTTTTASVKPGSGISSPAGGLSVGWPVYFYDDNDNVCTGFVSAGHAYESGDHATINGVTVGVCVDSLFSGRNDAALIKITNSNYSMSNVVDVSGHTLSSTRYLLVSEGATVYKVGDTSNYRTGTVTSTNGTVTYWLSDTESVTINDVLVTDAMNLGGDSGGVVYCKNGGNYYAIGTASGSKHSTNRLTESTFIECYVSQMLNAVQDLDCSYLPLS